MVTPGWLVAATVAAFVGAPATAATPSIAACDDVLPAASRDHHERTITAEGLVRLRDIGQPDASLFGASSPLAVSPDGTRLAFVVNRADPVANRHCRALVVVEVGAGGVVRVVDRGGDLITITDVQRNLYREGGFPDVVQPSWSPDGRWIAYLRRDNGRTQAWRAAADGSGAGMVTHAASDVEAVDWSSDGARLVFASTPDRIRAEQAIGEEGRRGFLYDERFVPNSSAIPKLKAPFVREVSTIDPASLRIARADAADRARVATPVAPGSMPPLRAHASDGRVAWTERDGSSPLGPMALHATDASGRRWRCQWQGCLGAITGVWWNAMETEIVFLRRQGWANGQMALYRWRPGAAQPRRVMVTDDVIQGCIPIRALLACTSEGSSVPRRIVLLDPVTGSRRLVFDPNPEFARFRLGSVRRLTWRNNLGLEAWGDLVVPPGWRPGTRLPMVVVQYHSDGFLRGGTGDEYPIFALAAHGFAVLSIERPAFFGASNPSLRTADQIIAANGKDWAERRSLLSSLTTGVEQAISLGIADPKRLGITGLSDGSSTARFALINSRLFAAAAISTCCLDPKTVMTYGGIAYADSLQRQGYPRASVDDAAFWSPYSLALNAATMSTPLLMQLSDDDYLLSLEAFTALREHGQPVEMYVFPGEFHAKWQPAHRQALYERNIDWFAFWLQGRVDPDPAKAAQYARWRALREKSTSTLATPSTQTVAPSARP